ncbi:FUSC family protein [Ancylobacter moscoviensis]
MTWPSWRDWLFSAKAFTAAMLAFYVALAFGLERPYWAMTAVYVVANPISGATVSKAFDRAFGTLLGCAGAVVLVGTLSNAPELLTLAIAVWAGVLMYIALHDRTPRNYVFMLAGYTLPLVALPNVNAPETIFDIAVARSEEIIIGIAAAAIIGPIVFPMSLRPVLDARIRNWLNDAASWAREILLAKGDDPRTPLTRQRLAADITPLDAMISQSFHDADTRDIRRYVEELRGRLLLLLPLLSSIADRMHGLRLELDAFPPQLEALTERIATWISAPAAGDEEPVADQLRAELKNLAAPADAGLWKGLVWSSLVSRLLELIDLWQDCLALQRLIAPARATSQWKPRLRHRPVIGTSQYYDRAIMAFAVGSTVLATFLAGLLWIWSGWPGGANAVAFVTIACCFFGGLDRPAPLMKTMLVYSMVAYAVSGVYLFAILPRINDFEMIVLVLAPPFLLVGAFIPRPQLFLITLLLAANLAGDLGLQGRYSGEFTTYAEGAIAIAAGLLFAIVWTHLTRPFGAELAAHRLVLAGWKDLARLAAGSDRRDHAHLISRTLDRLGQLMPRLASSTTPALQSIDGLAELRMGYNIIALQRDRRIVPADARDAIDEVLRDVAAYFQSCSVQGVRQRPPDSLSAEIDLALGAVLATAKGQVRQASLDALVGLRRALFPSAPGPSGEVLRRGGDDAAVRIAA